ncbi:MAG: hypothetical protein GX550_07925 [Syntrophomonadaceae bacterium]|nr:hypothetical protein [Syntrophomonadaceae bacterium]
MGRVSLGHRAGGYAPAQLLRGGSEERTTVAEQLRRGMAGGGVGAVPQRTKRSKAVW